MIISSSLFGTRCSLQHITSMPNSRGHGFSMEDIEDSPVKYFQAAEVERLRNELLEWYDTNHRILPWRINPYSNHISKPANVPHSRVQTENHLLNPESDNFVSYTWAAKRARSKRAASSKNSWASIAGVMNSLTIINDAESKSEISVDRAYAVWVSEIMCQQTRIAVVISYYNQWMDRWPTVRALSEASVEEVNELWAGLGYYRRARFLYEGAKYVMTKLNGRIPSTTVELMRIPGIGKYTAGAIASIAFGEVTPVVDGNVVRLMSRLRAISGSVKVKSVENILWDLSGQLVDRIRPGDFNQALMELGSTICTPTSPDCDACPISSHCLALQKVKQFQTSGMSGPEPSVVDFPTKSVKAARREEHLAVCVVKILTNGNTLLESTDASVGHACQYLLVKRPEKGLLAGQWEFPSVMLKGKSVGYTERKKVMNFFLKEKLGFDIQAKGRSGLQIMKRVDVGNYCHVFSHINQHYQVENLLLSGPNPWLENGDKAKELTIRWVGSTEINDAGLTSGVRKILGMI